MVWLYDTVQMVARKRTSLRNHLELTGLDWHKCRVRSRDCSSEDEYRLENWNVQDR